MKISRFSFAFVFFVLVLSINFSSADCKISGCVAGEMCMADSLCTSFSVMEYCKSKGFSYSESLLKKNCSSELPREREFLCKQCKGDYEYTQRVSGMIGIIFNVGAGIAVLLLVLNGFHLLTSKDLAERQNAKKAILFVIFGLIILILARTIMGLLFLPPMIVPETTSTTVPGSFTTTTHGVPTTLPVSRCIGFSTCTDCLGKGCKWCKDPILGASICVTKCDDCTTILGACFDSTCPITPTTTTITTTTIVTTSTTTTTTINVPCADLTPPNCNGFCPSGEVCREISGACNCITLTTTTSTTTTTTVPVKVKLTVMFVPVNWIGSLSSFDAAVNAQANEILKNTPLKDCPSSFVVKKAKSNCNIGYMGCECSELNSIKSCAKGTGESYDYVVGLHNGDVCGDILGFSCHTGTVFSETKVTMVTVHELGHEWGLRDEYCSQVCSGCPAGPPNALSSNEFCDPQPGGNCCYACVGYGVHCKGNVQKDCIDSSGKKICDGRAIMGSGGAPGPRGQDRPSWSHLLKISKLNCN